MVAVAAVALMLWVARLLSLSAMYRDKARQYDIELMGATPILMGPRERHRIIHPPSAHLLWGTEMTKKYRHASWYPWLPVEPEPPEPE